MLRRVKPELEIQHARILGQDQAVLVDEQLIFSSELSQVILSLEIPTQFSSPSFPGIEKTVRTQTELLFSVARNS